MKPSTKLWYRFGVIACTVLVIFCLNQTYIMYEASKDFKVPVTITGTYSQGYHGKYSVGEDFYVNCYNQTYGNLTIKVSYNTFNRLKKGNETTFTLDKLDIDRYSSSDENLVSKYMVLYITLSVIVYFLLLILIIDRIVTIVKKFNAIYDEIYTKDE